MQVQADTSRVAQSDNGAEASHYICHDTLRAERVPNSK